MTSKQTKTKTKSVTQQRQTGFVLDAALARQDPAAKEQGVSIPVNELILEATRCYDKASELRGRFVRLPNFETAYLDHLPSLAEALAEAEHGWQLANTSKRANSVTPVRTLAEKLRSDILADARYLFRKESKTLAKLDDISHGTTTSDLAADLRKLAVFVKGHAKVFFADGSRPTDLASQAAGMAEKLLHGNDQRIADDAQSFRNQVYHLLQEYLDEVRGAARYLLKDDPKRLAPMLSRYNAIRQKTLRKAKKKSDPAKGKPAPDAPVNAVESQKTDAVKGSTDSGKK